MIAGAAPESMTPSSSRSRRDELFARHVSSSSSMRWARALGAGPPRSSVESVGVSAVERRSCVAAAFIALVTEARSCLGRRAIWFWSSDTRCSEP